MEQLYMRSDARDDAGEGGRHLRRLRSQAQESSDSFCRETPYSSDLYLDFKLDVNLDLDMGLQDYLQGNHVPFNQLTSWHVVSLRLCPCPGPSRGRGQTIIEFCDRNQLAECQFRARPGCLLAAVRL